MSRYWVSRLLQSLYLWIGASIIIFVVLHLAPGDPASFLVEPEFLTEETLVELRQSLGLDDPLPIQYLKTISTMVTGDLYSFYKHDRTSSIILGAIPVTFSIVFLGVFTGTLFGVPLGLAAGRRSGSLMDRMLSLGIVSAVSIPTFVLALLLIRLFAEEWGLLPASGIRPVGSTSWNPVEMLPHVILPTFVTGLHFGLILARYTRDAVQDVLAEDFVRTAYAKGLTQGVVMRRHVMRNVLVPVVSVVGTFTPMLLGGSVIVEQVFALPGLGRLTVAAAIGRDYPLVMSTVLFSALLVIVGNLAVDFLYGIVDPRIKLR